MITNVHTVLSRPWCKTYTMDSMTTFIHSIGMYRIWQFLAVLRSFFHSSLLCTFSCHPSPPTILPSSLTSSCHLFPLNLVVPKFIYNTLLGILFCSILCTCPNQHNLFNLTVSIVVGFLTLAQISLLVNILQFSFSLSYTIQRPPKKKKWTTDPGKWWRSQVILLTQSAQNTALFIYNFIV